MEAKTNVAVGDKPKPNEMPNDKKRDVEAGMDWASKVRATGSKTTDDIHYRTRINKLKADVMASPKVTHSNYVPAQVERNLAFMDFNKGAKFAFTSN